jgi:molybdopterin-guanine dinucleotide biosynthesis protein A
MPRVFLNASEPMQFDGVSNWQIIIDPLRVTRIDYIWLAQKTIDYRYNASMREVLEIDRLMRSSLGPTSSIYSALNSSSETFANAVGILERGLEKD